MIVLEHFNIKLIQRTVVFFITITVIVKAILLNTTFY